MSVDTKGQAVEAEDIFTQVRRQLRREALMPQRGSAVRTYSGAVRSWRRDAGPAGAPPAGAPDTEEIAARLQALFASLDTNFAARAAQIGAMPPATPTLRGRLGSAVIGALQGLLWWYTRSLHRFAESVGVHLRDATEAIESLACMQEANRLEIAALREEVRRLREEAAGGPGECR